MKLQVKVLAAIAPLTLVACGLILALSNDAVYRILLDAAAERGRHELNQLSAKLAGDRTPLREQALLPLLGRSLELSGGAYALALDREGVVRAHTNVVMKGRALADPATRRALASPRPEIQLVSSGGEEFLDISAPLWGPGEDFLLALEKDALPRVGTLRLGLPLSPALQTRRRILLRVGAILVATFLIVLLIIALLVRRMLAPIRLLAQAAARIGAGHGQVAVSVLTRDEIGELAGSFNAMSARLAATTVSKEYLDGVLQSIADAVIVCDREGAIRTMNRAARELSGYSDAELLGQPIDRLFAGENPAAALRFARDLDLPLRTKAGDRVPVLLSSAILVAPPGAEDGFVLVAKDLSERKKLEAMLLQSEKLSAVGQLAAGVAHEINNPLGVILGFAESAKRRIGGGHELELPLRSIEREALRCRALVQSLLAFSRRSQPAREPLDVAEVAAEALGMIEARAKLRGVRLARGLEPGLRVHADKNQLQQVLVNLCNNALDAMPGGGRLIVRARCDAPRRLVILEVEDEGPGIPPGIRDKIFTPFFTTKEVGKGTGLGLALVYEIVSQHQGNIDFDSAPGRTVFAVSLPADEGPGAQGGGACA